MKALPLDDAPYLGVPDSLEGVAHNMLLEFYAVLNRGNFEGGYPLIRRIPSEKECHEALESSWRAAIADIRKTDPRGFGLLSDGRIRQLLEMGMTAVVYDAQLWALRARPKRR